MQSKRKLILYVAMSLDGFIAGPNDDLSFLNIVQQEGEDYGYGDFIQTIDTVIMGRRTYDWVLTQVTEFPHANKETFVITRTERPGKGRTKFYTGNLKDLILQLKGRAGKDIFCDGGALVVNEFLKEKLIDEFYISVIPVLLGKGVRLFNDDHPEQLLKLVSSKSFKKGLVQMHYTRNGPMADKI
jgi:dihydrofolate reductase